MRKVKRIISSLILGTSLLLNSGCHRDPILNYLELQGLRVRTLSEKESQQEKVEHTKKDLERIFIDGDNQFVDLYKNSREALIQNPYTIPSAERYFNEHRESVEKATSIIYGNNQEMLAQLFSPESQLPTSLLLLNKQIYFSEGELKIHRYNMKSEPQKENPRINLEKIKPKYLFPPK